MMKECKGEFSPYIIQKRVNSLPLHYSKEDEFLYFEKNYLKFGLLYYRSEGVLFFDDNDNNNMLLILKYNVKTTILFY